MLNKPWTALLRAFLVLWLVGALTGCKRQATANPDADGDMHKRQNILAHPDWPKPTVEFPQQLQTDDVAVNEFIHSALESCKTGDYDKFRELFGVTADVPEAPQFDHAWQGVKSIRVVGTKKGPQDPPEYYVHLVVELRQPDRYERTERQAVMSVFREANQWRMAPAPSEIQRLILFANTQPGEGNGPATRPSHRHASSRPAVSAALPAR